jgi:hypothetical protein
MNEEYIIEHLKRFDEEVDLPIALYGGVHGGQTRPQCGYDQHVQKGCSTIKNIRVKVAAREFDCLPKSV